MITIDYGARIAKNLKPDALSRLIMGYHSHSFVIDRKEARDLFINVREPSADETILEKKLSGLVAYPHDELKVCYADRTNV